MVKPSTETDDAIRTAHVLELDPDLGADLDPQRLASARADLIAPLAGLAWTSREGRWGPQDGGAHLGEFTLPVPGAVRWTVLAPVVKHVEGRLLVQFWQLAERWGHMDRDGIAVSSPLTHELLAKLVGAARPSVTTALGRLAERGLLLRSGDVRRLSGESRGVVMSAF
jgi:hypothetical protein